MPTSAANSTSIWFTATQEVSFGSVDALSYTVVSDSQITAIVPSESTGTVDVRVITDVGSSVIGSSDDYTFNAAPAPSVTTAGQSIPDGNSRFTYSAASAPTVTGLSPTSGTDGGGTTVVITGTNFTSATDVTFGGIDATSFTVNS